MKPTAKEQGMPRNSVVMGPAEWDDAVPVRRTRSESRPYHRAMGVYS